jgi:antitoxin ParD1/3/4
MACLIWQYLAKIAKQERFAQKWVPVLRNKMRQNKVAEHRFDSIKTKRAPGARIMPTRNVSLTEHQDKLIDQLIASGRYQNASEVMRQSMRLLEEQEAAYQAKLEKLRAEIQIGIDAYQRGEFVTLETDEDIDRMFDEIATKVIRRGASKRQKAA